jgi:preprotein translocase subunit Sec63
LLFCFAIFVTAVLSAVCSEAASPSKGTNYYELLGLTQKEAQDAAVLKKAYRKLALMHHPGRKQR